jgi:hypothetical protein
MAAILLLGGPAPFGAKTLLTVGSFSVCRMLLILSFALVWRVGFWWPLNNHPFTDLVILCQH